MPGRIGRVLVGALLLAGAGFAAGTRSIHPYPLYPFKPVPERPG